jgi:hypothetical protein
VSLLESATPREWRTRAELLSCTQGPTFRWEAAGWGNLVRGASHVFATREVRAVAGADQFGDPDRKELIEQLRHSAQSMLTAAAGGRGSGAALELRYVTEPAEESPTRVRLFITAKRLGTPETVGRAARTAVESACSHLPKGYQWGEPDDVNLSFPPDSSLIEVRKQEQLIEPTLVDVPTSYYYLAHPVAGDGRGWAHFGRVLADTRERVVVSILFAPVGLDPAELGIIDAIVTMLEHYGKPRQLPDVMGTMEQIPPDGGAATALPVWHGYQESLRQCLLARATVVGQTQAASVVAKALASAAGLTDQEAASVPPVTQRPRDDEAVARAMHSLGYLDVVPWGGHSVWSGNDAPHTLRRLPYLYGLSEAAALAVLPVPDDQGAPGFLRARRVAHRRMASIRTDEAAVHLGHLKHEGSTGGSADLPLSAINRHVLVVGAPGSGKTMTVLSLLTRLWCEKRVPFMAIEPTKTEYRSLLTVPGFEDLRIVTFGRDDVAPIRLNPLAPPPGVRCETHMNSVMAAFRAALPLEPPMPQLLEDALERSYEQAGWEYDTTGGSGLQPPTLRDLLESYERGFDRLEYRGEVRSTLLAAVKVRLSSLMKGARGMLLDTVESVDFSELTNRPVVIEMDEIADADDKAILAAFVLDRIRASARARGSGSTLRHVTVLEEAHRLLSRQGANSPEGPRASSIRAFCEAIAELRALGEGFIISSQSPSALAEAAVANTGTKILHRLESSADRDVVLADVDASDDERKAAARLERGEAVVKWPQLDELEFVSVIPPAGVDSGSPVSNEQVQQRMAAETAEVRRLLPYRMCTRHVCEGGCRPERRARGLRIARAVGDEAAAVWHDAAPRTVDALAPIAKMLAAEADGDVAQAYCGAVHLAARGEAFAGLSHDIGQEVAEGIIEAVRGSP